MVNRGSILFRIEEYDCQPLDRSNKRELEALQALFERSIDYIHLVKGFPIALGEARSLLKTLPGGKKYSDKFVIGLFDRSGRLTGVIDLIRDHPYRGEWYLGLMMLEPDRRGLGLGGKVYRALERWATRNGARRIRILVAEQNEKAVRFWRRLGFTERRRATQTLGEKRILSS